MSSDVKNLERELMTYRVKLEEYRDSPKIREHYAMLYRDALRELSHEPPSVWKHHAAWYARYERW